MTCTSCPKCGGTSGYSFSMIVNHPMLGLWGESAEAGPGGKTTCSLATCIDCGGKVHEAKAQGRQSNQVRLSPQMVRMLEDVRDGHGTHGTAFGRSQHGGRYGTAIALRQRGLLDYSNELTDTGRAALEELKGPKA